MTTTTPPDITPTIADVAALIRARTKDDDGREQGTFTDKTRPTETQAQEAIDHALDGLHEKVGSVGGGCAKIARLCVAYGAAAEIELSYFPEQARTDRSPYQYLIKRWEESLEGVRECVLGNLPGEGEEGPTGGFGYGTIQTRSGVAFDYYAGDVGLLGEIPGEPAPPPEPEPEPEP